MDQHRKIIHVDMDYFFAQVEIRDNPALKNKPVVISGPPESRSVVSTCNYVAREYGIHAGMPAFQIPKLCPNAVYIMPNMHKYKQISNKIHELFANYSDLVETGGIDEAYIDVTHNKKGIASATEVGRLIQNEIYNTMDLTCSIGIGQNKLVAKIASDYNKPAGMTIIKPNGVEEFFNNIPIYKIPGVGKKSLHKYYKFGIYFGRDFKKLSLEKAEKYFGKSGINLFYAVRGQSSDDIITFREAKSIGYERTLKENISGSVSVVEELNKAIRQLKIRLDRNDKSFKTLTVKIKFSDFHQITRSKTSVFPIITHEEIYQLTKEILLATPIENKHIRLLGLSASSLVSQKEAKSIMRFTQIYLDLEI